MQWQPLCAADPTPGDPDEVEAAGRHYSSMAAEIEDQVARLKNLVDSTLAGAYVQTLTDAAGGLGEELGQASGRYRQVGGTLQEHWAPALRDFQDEAEHLRRKAAAAGAQMFNNRALEADGSWVGRRRVLWWLRWLRPRPGRAAMTTPAAPGSARRVPWWT